MRKVWAGNKVEEEKKHSLPQPPEIERGRSKRKREVIMDSFMSGVKKKSCKKTEETQNWRDAPVIEHTRSKV